jgi:hypothetical protein
MVLHFFKDFSLARSSFLFTTLLHFIPCAIIRNKETIKSLVIFLDRACASQFVNRKKNKFRKELKQGLSISRKSEKNERTEEIRGMRRIFRERESHAGIRELMPNA